MSRASQVVLFVFVLSLALCGCTEILGDFLVAPGGGDLDAGSTDATAPDAMSGEGGMGATGDATNRADAGTDATGDATNRVDAAGIDATNVGDAGRLDATNQGEGGVCADSTTRCSANGGVETCLGGAWLAAVPCSNQACSMGMCTGACAPNTTQCSGNGVQKCDATGHWGPATACTNKACVSGACQGVCMPGDTTCSSNAVQTCDSTGAWRPAMPCGAHQTCMGGGAAGVAVCKCNIDPTCQASGLTCASGTTLAVCAQDAQACWYASSTSTCSNGACFGSPGSAQCCTNACTSGATQCGGAGLQTCRMQGNGCTAWNAGTACGPHQSCTGSAPSATCTCNPDPCAGAATACATSTSTETCAADAQNCRYVVSTSPCGANKNCVNGSCVCNSGYTLCGGNCVNVNSDNNNCGSCGHVCPVLSAPSSGSTCGLLAVGQCAGYVGGYVQAGGTLASNPSGSDVFAIKATMPAVSGTFVGVGGLFGSNATSGSTQMIFGLYSDSGGVPGALLFYTNDPDPSLQFADPSPLITLRSTGGLYQNGFNNALAANTTYWVYMKAGTGISAGDIGGVSSSPCVGANWINVAPPGTFSAGSATCPGDFDLYMIVTFP